MLGHINPTPVFLRIERMNMKHWLVWTQIPFQKKVQQFLLLFRQKLEEEEVERRTNQVTFVRPDGSIEGKDVAQCESNNFFQIDDNVWTGPWGRGLEDAKEYKRLHLECQKKKGRFRKVGPDTFKKIMSIKKKGNRYFGFKRYDEAVREYNKALELFPIFFEVSSRTAQGARQYTFK